MVVGCYKYEQNLRVDKSWEFPDLRIFTGLLISPQPDQEGNKLGSMSETRAISTTSRRELSSSFFFPARQGAEGNSCHSDRIISLFPSWSGLGLISTSVYQWSVCLLFVGTGVKTQAGKRGSTACSPPRTSKTSEVTGSMNALSANYMFFKQI